MIEIVSTAVQLVAALGILLYLSPELRRDLRRHWYVFLISAPLAWYLSKGLVLILIPDLDLREQVVATQRIAELLPHVLLTIIYMGIARVGVDVNKKLRGHHDK